jgi:hypothetical protein
MMIVRAKMKGCVDNGRVYLIEKRYEETGFF